MRNSFFDQSLDAESIRQRVLQVESGGSQYSAMAQLANGSIALLFDAGGSGVKGGTDMRN